MSTCNNNNNDNDINKKKNDDEDDVDNNKDTDDDDGGAFPLQWRHNGRDDISNHQPHDCLVNRLFRRRP